MTHMMLVLSLLELIMISRNVLGRNRVPNLSVMTGNVALNLSAKRYVIADRDLILIRGGEVEKSEEDALLDAYIEKILNNPESFDKSPPRKKKRRRSEANQTSGQIDSSKIDKSEVVESDTSIHSKRSSSSYDKSIDEISTQQCDKNMTEMQDFGEKKDTPEQPFKIPEKQALSLIPPNRLQRILMTYGFVGRALAAIIAITSELIDCYLPDVGRILETILPRSPSEIKRRSKDRQKGGIHSQYAVFTSGSGIGGKKASKIEKKILDQVALDKLKQVKGGTKKGKYTHLSLAFMKKYNLGEKFASEAKVFESIIAPIERDVGHVSHEKEEATSDYDDDWIVAAFQDDIDSGTMDSWNIIDSYSHFEPKSRKSKKIKAGDREGVMNRLRTTGVASVSSKLMGAYPGDAYSIEDSASKYGVTELAERYGYGDWSESDEINEFRSKSKSRKKRKSRSKGKSERSNFSFSFDVGLSASSSATKNRTAMSSWSSSRQSGNRNDLNNQRIPSDDTKEKSLSGEREKLQRRLDLSNDLSVRAPMRRTKNKYKANKDGNMDN